MKRKNLYKFERPGGGYTVSPVKPDNGDFWRRYRLIAEDGKAITNGEITTTVIDVESYAGWHDCEPPDELQTDPLDEGIQ